MASRITPALYNKIASLPPIPTSVDIDNFFQKRVGMGCIKWFNSTVANRGPWAGVVLVDTPANDLRFHRFWNQSDAIFGGDARPVQFLCLMSIIANEVRGNFIPPTEKIGIAGHPGLAYPFDAIPSMKKRSYNTLAGNKTARDCFNNAAFVAAHGHLPLAGRAARTVDARWAGEVWPADFPTKPDLAETGFLMQADFMKFRGRGYIQTTGRANYLPLIEFAQAFTGTNSTIDYFRHRWTGKTPDQAAFESSNDDWDRLFGETDMIIAAEAIRQHNMRGGKYLALGNSAEALDGTGPGSVHFMGLKISGGSAYAEKFKDRVAAVLEAL